MTRYRHSGEQVCVRACVCVCVCVCVWVDGHGKKGFRKKWAWPKKALDRNGSERHSMVKERRRD